MIRWRNIPPAARLAIGLLGLVAVGTGLLHLPGVSSGRLLSWSEALFTAVSALSVTGLSLIQPGRDLTLFGQLILMFLIQAGGVGFMVMAVVLFRLVGRRIMYLDRIALRDSLGLIDMRAILRFTRRLLWMVGVIELIGAWFLWLNWRGMLGDGRAAFYALFHSVAAFCNAGFDLFTGVDGFSGIPNDGATLTILGGLIFLGSLGMPVLMDLWDYPEARKLSFNTRLTLVVVIGLVLLGTFGLFLSESTVAGTLRDEPFLPRLGLSLFQSVATRTAGYAGINDLETLSPAGQLIKIGLMFVGSAPASMGGGITTGTFIVLALTFWSYIRRRGSARIFSRTIPPDTVRRALAVLTISLFVVFNATWLILLTHPHATLDQVLFEVISAFATCGFTLAFTGQLNLFGQLIIVFVMFWGRLGALTIILALAGTPRRELVEYPEGQVLIG
ncbi:MAG: potassium transporter [Anaerolineales bacterium]|nr:potassium transporter [Anaerolineales bacterium]